VNCSCENTTKLLISKNPDVANGLFLENFPEGRTRSEATVDCKGNITLRTSYFSVVDQSGEHNYVLSGSGTYSNNFFMISYKLNERECTINGFK
jgi:hypothetical protein